MSEERKISYAEELRWCISVVKYAKAVYPTGHRPISLSSWAALIVYLNSILTCKPTTSQELSNDERLSK